MSDEKFHTVPEVAKTLRVKPITVYKLIREDKLQCVKVGRLIRISESQLKAFVEGKGGAGETT